MDALAMLRLQMEWGADEALEDAPVDRLRAVAAPGPARAARPAAAAPPPVTPGMPVERAMRAAAEAKTLSDLKAAAGAIEGDPLRDMATNMVFATGDPGAGLLLIGGSPGADEDRAGIPFAGAEGALLDRMLGSIGLRRETVLLAPLIPWRPPGGRVPNPGELQLYRPFLMRLIALTAPARIVLFGPLAATTVLGAARRGRAIGWIEAAIDGRVTPVLILPAPGELLKTPGRRKDAWTGMRLLRRALDNA